MKYLGADEKCCKLEFSWSELRRIERALDYFDSAQTRFIAELMSSTVQIKKASGSEEHPLIDVIEEQTKEIRATHELAKKVTEVLETVLCEEGEDEGEGE